MHGPGMTRRRDERTRDKNSPGYLADSDESKRRIHHRWLHVHTTAEFRHHERATCHGKVGLALAKAHSK
jgi:hypothetical protein